MVIDFVAWSVPGGLPFTSPIESYGMRLINSICSIAKLDAQRPFAGLPVGDIEETSNPPRAVATIRKIVRPNTTSASVNPPMVRGDAAWIRAARCDRWPLRRSRRADEPFCVRFRSGHELRRSRFTAPDSGPGGRGSATDGMFANADAALPRRARCRGERC